jgi:hypothetical protein
MGGVWYTGWSETPADQTPPMVGVKLQPADQTPPMVGMKLQLAEQTPPIQSDKYPCRIDTVIFPDDGHMVA